jgi:hypothetical protein
MTNKEKDEGEELYDEAETIITYSAMARSNERSNETKRGRMSYREIIR